MSVIDLTNIPATQKVVAVNPDGTPLAAGTPGTPAGGVQSVQGVSGGTPVPVKVGNTVSVTVTPTVTAANAYGINYVIGGLLTFANAFTSTGSGILQDVVVTIKKVEAIGFTFVPFNSNPSNTTWTDAAVAAINAADVATVREPVSLSNYSGLGTQTVASAVGLGQAMAPGSTTLYGVLIGSAALTNQFGSTSDVTVTVKILQDP